MSRGREKLAEQRANHPACCLQGGAGKAYKMATTYFPRCDWFKSEDEERETEKMKSQ